MAKRPGATARRNKPNIIPPTKREKDELEKSQQAARKFEADLEKEFAKARATKKRGGKQPDAATDEAEKEKPAGKENNP